MWNSTPPSSLKSMERSNSASDGSLKHTLINIFLSGQKLFLAGSHVLITVMYSEYCFYSANCLDTGKNCFAQLKGLYPSFQKCKHKLSLQILFPPTSVQHTESPLKLGSYCTSPEEPANGSFWNYCDSCFYPSVLKHLRWNFVFEVVLIPLLLHHFDSVPNHLLAH